MVTRRTFVKGAVAAPTLGTALLASTRGIGAQDDPVIVGSKNFTEQFILAEMYAALLENADVPVELALNLGGTGVAQTALEEGEISLYPEYPGTALVEVLGIEFATLLGGATPAAGTAMASPMTGTPAAGGSVDELVYQTVKSQYEEQFGVTLLDQTPFNNTQALAMTRAASEERGITTISQLVEAAGDFTISAPVDFEERQQDGLPALQRVYGDFEFGELLAVDPGIKYRAIEEGDAEVVVAFGTDAQIVALDLVVLEDDRGLFPPYHVAPFVRQDVLEDYPAIADALNAVAPLLTDEVMSRLNGQVDLEEMEPEEVARQFLQEQGLIEG